MNLQDYIEILEQQPRDKVLATGLGNPHSWRGSYDELAFEPVDNTTIGEMLECANQCIGKVFEGWKGGTYAMDGATEIHVEVEDGVYSGNTFLLSWFFKLLLADPTE